MDSEQWNTDHTTSQPSDLEPEGPGLFQTLKNPKHIFKHCKAWIFQHIIYSDLLRKELQQMTNKICSLPNLVTKRLMLSVLKFKLTQALHMT